MLFNIFRYSSFFAYFGSYFYYSYCIINMLYVQVKRPLIKKNILKDAFIIFVLNILYFTICSALGLGLLKNFGLFWIVFYAEQVYIYKIPKQTAKFLTLHITLCTLSNILFFYGLLSIIINKPLAYCGNVFLPMDFRKIYALSISYFSTCFIFRFYSNERNAAPLRHLIASIKNMKFILTSMICLFVYLLFQGIMYSNFDNALSSKILSLSVCIYISVGFIFAVRYGMMLSYFYDLDSENLQLEQILNKQKREVFDLSDIADIDALTKIRNYTAGMRDISKWIQDKYDFVLCLIDLDSLKYINDNIGHKAGDEYLITVVQTIKQHYQQDRDLLWRYGGDEFLIAYNRISITEAKRRMNLISDEIKKIGLAKNLPMQISFGMTQYDKNSDFETMFSYIDKEMYAMKSKHKKENPKFIRN